MGVDINPGHMLKKIDFYFWNYFRLAMWLVMFAATSDYLENLLANKGFSGIGLVFFFVLAFAHQRCKEVNAE